MVSGIDSAEDAQDLDTRHGLKWKDVKDASDDHEGFLKPVIAAWLKQKNKYKPTWRELAHKAGCMDKECGNVAYRKIITEKKNI